MKLSIKQKILLEHLNYVIRGVSNKNLIPILNCIKFELTNEGLCLISTDNELSIKSFIPAKDIDNIEIQGEILISGRYIYDIVRKLTNEIINIEEIIDSQVLITTASSSFKLLLIKLYLQHLHKKVDQFLLELILKSLKI